MTAIRIRYRTIEFLGFDIHVRTLRDTDQFSDDEGEAHRVGIGEAQWPLFGVIWDAGFTLAKMVARMDVEGLQILEVGCGIGLPSLVLNHRGADITATDRHPEAGAFLALNAQLNGGDAIPFVRVGWTDGERDLMPRFDLVIGSDLLYERGHPDALSSFIERHCRTDADVLIVDPGRPNRGRFERHMVLLGFRRIEGELEAPTDDVPFPGKLLHFRRGRGVAPTAA